MYFIVSFHLSSQFFSSATLIQQNLESWIYHRRNLSSDYTSLCLLLFLSSGTFIQFLSFRSSARDWASFILLFIPYADFKNILVLSFSSNIPFLWIAISFINEINACFSLNTLNLFCRCSFLLYIISISSKLALCFFTLVFALIFCSHVWQFMVHCFMNKNKTNFTSKSCFHRFTLQIHLNLSP